MKLSNLYEIFVPTYNRASPNALLLLEKDRKIKLNFCIRTNISKEMQETYDAIQRKYKNRVNFIKLGKGIKDIGETRRRILKFAQANNIKYCMMMDDGLSNFYALQSNNEDSGLSPSDVVYYAVRELDKHNSKSNNKAIAYTFKREEDKFIGVSPTDNICTGMMQQAYIIDCELAKTHHIEFKSLKKVGFEDAAFMLDAFKAGLHTFTDSHIFMSGKAPNVIVVGGNHKNTDVKEFAKSYDVKSSKLAKYIGRMYGVSFEKKFRKRYNAHITYCIVNYSFFREVLVTFRKDNESLVASRFKM